jgi:hypothetical protein
MALVTASICRTEAWATFYRRPRIDALGGNQSFRRLLSAAM